MPVPTRGVAVTRLVALTAAACVVALDPGRASACGPPSCIEGWFLPQDGATVPANAPALAWRVPQDIATGGSNGMIPKVHLWRVDRDPAEVVDFTPESGTSGLT